MLDNVEYWLELCDDDLKTAQVLFDAKQYLWMGFICHLIAEKAIKAVIASKTNEVPPKTHKLTRLAEIGGIYDNLSEIYQDLLEKLTPLQIEGRYPEYKERINARLTPLFCKQLMEETEDFLCWIKQQLEKLPTNTPTE